MNLPIKLVDIVTLLFVSFLVVIIIFIILQRNIRRIKIRNEKEPHFITCKSIPKDLKDNIVRKHQKTHEYIDPPLLFTKTYQNQDPDRYKSMVIRMKAFDTSKSLDNALGECGFMRSSSTKFEEFIDNLIHLDDKDLPKSMLISLNKLYLSALFDPQPFTIDNLRELNQLINQIIQHMAKSKGLEEKVLRHLLELDSNGDFDLNKHVQLNTFAKLKPVMPTATKETSKFLFGHLTKSSRADSNPIESVLSTTAQTKSSKHAKKENKKVSLIANESTTKESSPFLAKDATTSGNGESSSKKKAKVTSSGKYTEIKDTSFDSTNSASQAASGTKMRNKSNSAGGGSSSKQSHKQEPDLDEIDQSLRWSAANESLKNYDSENEEIPLVLVKKPTHHKKKSSHSALANIISSTSSTSNQNVNNSSVTTNVEYSGALNQGFNETNF